MIKVILALTILLIPFLTFGQGTEDWPSTSFDHSYENVDQKEGLEYFESGNLHARGPLTESDSRNVVKVSENRRVVKETVYARTGIWTVYYDSSLQIVRSSGSYANGKKNGVWKVFDRKGNLKSEYTFYNDLIQSKVDVDESGNRNIVLNRSNGTMFILSYDTLLFILGLLPIVGIRVFWNIVVWNKIYKTNYIPGFAKFKAGELNANVYCMIIFWWLHRDADNATVKTFKRIGNWISVLSVVIFGMFVALLAMYGE